MRIPRLYTPQPLPLEQTIELEAAASHYIGKVLLLGFSILRTTPLIRLVVMLHLGLENYSEDIECSERNRKLNTEHKLQVIEGAKVNRSTRKLRREYSTERRKTVEREQLIENTTAWPQEMKTNA
jgi:hypothetical protein